MLKGRDFSQVKTHNATQWLGLVQVLHHGRNSPGCETFVSMQLRGFLQPHFSQAPFPWILIREP